jgi:hypothetical protein
MQRKQTILFQKVEKIEIQLVLRKIVRKTAVAQF